MAGRRDYRGIALVLVAWHQRCAGLTPRASAGAGGRGADSGSPGFERWWEIHGRDGLRCLLIGAWDPAGVSYLAHQWDRYDRHLAGVAARLREHAGTEDWEEDAAQAVAEHLCDIDRDDADTPGARHRDYGDIAGLLVAWYEYSFILGGRVPRLADPNWYGDEQAVTSRRAPAE